MKILVSGVRHQSGISKKNLPYSMMQVCILTPVEQVSNENLQIKGTGFAEGRIDLSESGFKQFMTSGLSFPVEVDCSTDTDFRQGRAVTVVTGFKQ